MNCPDQPTLSEFADGEIAAPRADAIRQHVLNCEVCREFVEEMQWTSERGRAAVHSVSAELVAPNNVVPLPTPRRGTHRLAWTAAAAVVVLGCTIGGLWWFKHERAADSTQLGNNGEKNATVLSSDQAFAQWTARYRAMEIPRVSLEFAANYDPEPIPPVHPH